MYSITEIFDKEIPPNFLAPPKPLKVTVAALTGPARNLNVVDDVVPAIISCSMTMQIGAPDAPEYISWAARALTVESWKRAPIMSLVEAL